MASNYQRVPRGQSPKKTPKRLASSNTTTPNNTNESPPNKGQRSRETNEHDKKAHTENSITQDDETNNIIGDEEFHDVEEDLFSADGEVIESKNAVMDRDEIRTCMNSLLETTIRCTLKLIMPCLSVSLLVLLNLVRLLE